jgi:serine/threonine protein kinase
MSADRNLLLGVLALRMDFIDQDTLIRALRAWILEKHKPLGQLLVEQGGLAAEHRAILEPLVDAHVRAHGGAPQFSLAALGPVTSVCNALSGVSDTDLQSSLRTVAGHDLHATGPLPVSLPTTAGQRYRVLRPHAQGGLGYVSVALDEELRRQVALKEIRPEYADDPAARSRFLLEAEVTGQLEHPGVIPVYGLGWYPDGRPYYAMRFVRGDSKGDTLHEAIARFHRANGHGGAVSWTGERALGFRRLLGRFVAACNTVAYAHSRGVLHRDLKPENILLGPYGETLVIDWGLAKQTRTAEGAESAEEEKRAGICPLSFSAPSAPSAVSSPHTLPGQIVGTPGYMAPEQAAGELERMGPASDVYGLGATLYALLTGRPPVVGRDAGLILDLVQKGDFPRPRAVQPVVPAALEAVCLKAMALAPEARYGSALELAADVEHWLADEPVAAYPEPLSARLRRQARRHPAALAATAALLLAGLAGLSLGLAAVRAEEQRTAEQRDLAKANAARAEAVNKFLTDDLLAEAAPDKNPQAKQVTVEEVLDKAATKVEKGFPGQPLVEASVQRTLAQTYWLLGRHAKGEPHARQALALYRGVRGPDDPDTLTAVDGLANLLYGEGKRAEALPLYRQNLEDRRRVLGPDHPDTLTAVNNLATLLADQGKLAEAEALYRQNLEAFRRVCGPDHPETLSATTNLAILLQAQGNLAEAEPLARQGLEAFDRVKGADHPDTLAALNNLALLLQAQGKLAEAEPLYRKNLEACRRVQGPDHPNTLRATNNLAMLLADQGKLAEAVTLTRQNLEARQRIRGPEHPDTLTAANNLASLLRDQGKAAEAEALFRQNLERYRRVLGPEHPHALVARNNLARLLRDQDKQAEAEALAREALTLGRKVLPAGHPTITESMALLGGVLTDTGRAAEAEPLLREALEQRRQALPPGHPKMAATESLLGACLAGQKRYAEAEPLLLSGYQALAKDPGTPEAQRQKARRRLVALYEAWGKPSEAARWK